MKRVLACWAVVGLLASPASAQVEYRISGGDTLQVNVWKNAELSQTVVVRPDGQVTLPLVRDIKAEGLTAMEFGKVLTERLGAFVNAPNVTVTVSAPTGYKVYTQGAIANGVHALPTPITARQLLSRAGGAAADADLSRAYVLRGAVRIPVDLSPGGRGGGPDEVGLMMSAGDILVVPVREVPLGRVLVVGEVVQPHAIPYVEGMTFLDALLGAGGAKETADPKAVRIVRQAAGGEATEVPVDLEALLKRGTVRLNVGLEPGDIVIVPFRFPQRVLVVGEVRKPASIEFREGLTLLDAYVEADGLTEFADADSVKVVRVGRDGKRQELGADLERVLQKADVSRNIALQPGDIVMVPR